MLIIEHSFVTQQGKANEGQLSVADDNLVEDLKKLSNIIHKNGSKAVMQINHSGSAAITDVTGYEPVGPSAIANPRMGNIPKELMKNEIKDIIDLWNSGNFDRVVIPNNDFLTNSSIAKITEERTPKIGDAEYGKVARQLVIPVLKKQDYNNVIIKNVSQG